MSNLIDFRFNYSIQNNPYKTKTDLNVDKLNKLVTNLNSDLTSFQTVNWVNACRYYHAISKNSIAFNQKLNYDIQNSPKLCNKVISSLREIKDKISTGYNTKLDEFISSPLIETIQPKEIQIEENQIPTEIVELPQMTSIEPIEDKPKISFIDIPVSKKNIKYNYNLSVGKTLTYQECVELVLNKSRSNLSNKVMKDENVLFIEEREKSRLRIEIKKYIGSNEKIRSLFPIENINVLSLKELQNKYEDIKKQYESEKLEDVLNKGLELVDVAYNSFCPNGIKIPGKNKAIKLNGIGESLQMVLNDRSSTTPIAFKNIQEKYKLYVPDEANLIFSILQGLLKNVSIVDYKEELTEIQKEQLIEKAKEDYSSLDESDESDDFDSVKDIN